jgi:MFS transporter, ACS family, tartrate transporter
MNTADATTRFEQATFTKVAWRILPLLIVGYIVAFLDRVNVGFAKLQMAGDLHFSDAVYGFGAGVFFIGYFCFEVPSNLVMTRVGARLWIARIMITWGMISSAFFFIDVIHWGGLSAAFGCTDAQFSFYFLRFLLGAAEAGFFPGVILYLTFWFPAARRAQMIAMFISSTAVSSVIGAPLSGAIMQFMDGFHGYRGWQWLFLLEGIPSFLMGFLFLALLSDGPRSAPWLTESERTLILARVQDDEAGKQLVGRRHRIADALLDLRLLSLTVLYFCGIVCFYAISFWMPTIVNELGIAPGDYFRVGLLSMIPWSVTVIAQVLWARHSDRSGERRWHSASGLIVAALGMLLLTVVGHAPIASLTALTLVMVGTGCWAVTFWSLPTAFLSGTAAAFGIAWLNSFGHLGGYVGPDLIGRIRTATGGDSSGAFVALAIAAALGAFLTIVTPARQRAARSPVEP